MGSNEMTGTEEKMALHRQGMVGFALYQVGSPWTGEMYQRRERAEKASQKLSQASVVLVRNTGQLYLQAQGRATEPLTTDQGQPVWIPLHRRRQKPAPRLTRTAQPRAASVKRQHWGHNYE